MKIIYIMGDNDYNALTFEEEYGTNPGIEVWNLIKRNEFLVIETENGDVDVSAKALEFSIVDQNFVGFIKSTLIDYDASKHTNFYVVKED